MRITKDIFTKEVGRAPENDDMERVNCKKAGQPGHVSCGWCALHKAPAYEGCWFRETVDQWGFGMLMKWW